MIEKKRVQWYASTAGVDLDIAEREIVLTYVLRLLFEAHFLDRLAFKGGTAIRKLHVGRTGRFSLDLDFTAVGAAEPETLILDLVPLLDSQGFHGITFSILDSDYWTTSDSCGAEVSYRHDWVQAGRFAIQISCRTPPLLPVREADLLPEQYLDWMDVRPPRVFALDLHEIVGEKVRAAAQRARVRDVYDLYQFADKPYDRDTVRQIAVIKCWETQYAFDPDAFLGGLADTRYDWGDLARLVRRDESPRPQLIVETVRHAYAFLKDFTPEEAQLARDPYRREVQLYKRLVEGLRSKVW